MAIAKTLEEYLQKADIAYELVAHSHTQASMETAESAHVPGDRLAKGVVLRDGSGLLLVVVPSDYHIELATLNKLMQRDLAFVPEAELTQIFPDCELGAVPPIGSAYSIKTIWDPKASLGRQDHVYFEAGDHATLVRVSGEHFHQLMVEADRAHFSHHL